MDPISTIILITTAIRNVTTTISNNNNNNNTATANVTAPSTFAPTTMTMAPSVAPTKNTSMVTMAPSSSLIDVDAGIPADDDDYEDYDGGGNDDDDALDANGGDSVCVFCPNRHNNASGLPFPDKGFINVQDDSLTCGSLEAIFLALETARECDDTFAIFSTTFDPTIYCGCPGLEFFTPEIDCQICPPLSTSTATTTTTSRTETEDPQASLASRRINGVTCGDYATLAAAAVTAEFCASILDIAGIRETCCPATTTTTPIHIETIYANTQAELDSTNEAIDESSSTTSSPSWPGDADTAVVGNEEGETYTIMTPTTTAAAATRSSAAPACPATGLFRWTLASSSSSAIVLVLATLLLSSFVSTSLGIY